MGIHANKRLTWNSNKKQLTYLVFFCVLHLPVCVLERCHSDTTAAEDQAAYSSTRTNILETAS